MQEPNVDPRHLEALHRVGLALTSSFEIDFILREIERATSMLTGGAEVDVHYLGRRGINALARWHPAEPTSRGLSQIARGALEKDPSAVPAGFVCIPIGHEADRLGLIVVHQTTLDGSTRRLLELLSLQAGAALENIHLTQERIHFERLAAMGRMIGSIVHDFRGPLTAARGYASMLAGSKLAPGRRTEYAQLLLEECDRLSGMTEELLELTRSGAGRLTRSWMSVSDYSRSLTREIEKSLEGSNVRLDVSTGCTEPFFVDRSKLLRAMLNVVTNARQAMPRGGVFEVRIQKENDRVRFRFRDTGCGIPESIAHRVFEPFFTYGKAQGIGLGTTIAKKIVEDHGGEVRIESREGSGTTVEFLLPLEPQPGTPEQEPDATSQLSAKTA